MKRVILALALTAAFGASSQAIADDCKVSLCMWGYLNGENDGTCKDSISEYFDIIAYKKKHKIDLSKTASKRLSKLKSCSDADSGKMKEVNNKFGKVIL
jgi:hypothetical protein